MTTWSLECSACVPIHTRNADGLPGVCDVCGSPYLVRYDALPTPEAKTLLRGRRWTMWRYASWLPLAEGEHPVTLGEGGTPLLTATRLGARHAFERLWVKDESTNPTGSFKARGLAAAVTRAVRAGLSSSWYRRPATPEWRSRHTRRVPACGHGSTRPRIRRRRSSRRFARSAAIFSSWTATSAIAASRRACTPTTPVPSTCRR